MLCHLAGPRGVGALCARQCPKVLVLEPAAPLRKGRQGRVLLRPGGCRFRRGNQKGFVNVRSEPSDYGISTGLFPPLL